MIDHLSITTHVGDRWAKSTIQINKAYDVLTVRVKAKHILLAQKATLCNENLHIKGTLSGVQVSIFQEGSTVASRCVTPETTSKPTLIGHAFGEQLHHRLPD